MLEQTAGERGRRRFDGMSESKERTNEMAESPVYSWTRRTCSTEVDFITTHEVIALGGVSIMGHFKISGVSQAKVAVHEDSGTRNIIYEDSIFVDMQSTIMGHLNKHRPHAIHFAHSYEGSRVS